METRRALSSLASASLFVLAAGCGLPEVPGLPAPAQPAAITVPPAARIGATAVVREVPQVTQPRGAGDPGRLVYIDVGAPTGTVEKPDPAGGAPSGGGPAPDSTIDAPGAPSQDPGPVVVAQEPDKTAPAADPCREIAVGDPGACADQAALVAAANAACNANQYRLDRVTVSEQSTCDSLGHAGAVARCCPPSTLPQDARPSWCESRSIANAQCLPRDAFLVHAGAVCKHAGLSMSAPAFDACDLTGQQVIAMHFGCCGEL